KGSAVLALVIEPGERQPADKLIATDGNGITELIIVESFRRKQFSALAPIVGAAQVALENVAGAGVVSRMVMLGRADHDGVAIDADGKTEVVKADGVGGLEPLNLSPIPGAALIASKHVAGTDSSLERRADGDGVAVDAHGLAELISSCGIGRMELGDQTPVVGAALV